MEFGSHDIIVIEQALHSAMAQETDGRKINSYKEVLAKLKASSEIAIRTSAGPVYAAAENGLRFDYDDFSAGHWQ